MSEVIGGSGDDRRSKLEQLRALGFDPWPSRFADRREIAEVVPRVDEQPSPLVRVAGCE